MNIIEMTALVNKYGYDLTDRERDNLLRMLERLAYRGADTRTLIAECKALAEK